MSLCTLALLCLVAGLLPGQVAVGAKAPKVDASEILSGDVKSLADYNGRLILYDFFAHW
jgi:hypothetical protein